MVNQESMIYKYTMIYVDHFYFSLRDQVCFIDDYNQIPNGCSTVGLAFYYFDRNKIINSIQQVRPKTQRLLVVLAEPVGNIIEIIKMFQHDPGIVFFGDAVLNDPQPNFYTAISWFLGTNNFYANEFWAKQLLLSLDHSDNKPYKFDCLLGAVRPHRDVVESLYQQCSFKEQFLFTYFKKNVTQGIWNQDYSNHTLTSESTQVDKERGRYAAISAIIPDYIYNQSSHSIVCETTCFNEFNQYTEKVAKPMLAQRIFVAFCGQWYLKNLRSLGFRTFDSIIDESYDSEPDMKRRFNKAWAQVEYLCQADSSEMRSQTRDILIHNQQHFIANDWHKHIRQLIN